MEQPWKDFLMKGSGAKRKEIIYGNECRYEGFAGSGRSFWAQNQSVAS